MVNAPPNSVQRSCWCLTCKSMMKKQDVLKISSDARLVVPSQRPMAHDGWGGTVGLPAKSKALLARRYVR